jgi:YVTN family beta-propeller protein
MRSDYRVPHVRTSVGIATKISVLVVAVLAFLTSEGCGGGSIQTQKQNRGPVAASISGAIKVGTAPSAIAVDSTSNKIYVTDFGSEPTFDGSGCSASGGDVTAIDGATQTTSSVGFPFSGSSPMNPVATALNPAAHTLYVLAEAYWSGSGGRPISCGPFLGRMEVFDTTSFQQPSNRVMANFPAGIDVNPTTGSIYVTYPAPSGVVDIWDGHWNFVATVQVGSAPVGVAVDATSNKIYVANKGSNNISVIDGSTNAVIATVTDPNGQSPVAVGINPATNTIYVANSESNNLTVIDGTTDSVTATISVGTAPSGVAVDPQTNFIYVANAGDSQNNDLGNITVINGATNATTTLADANAKNPVAVAANPTTNKFYVANSRSNNVTVIDGAHE